MALSTEAHPLRRDLKKLAHKRAQASRSFNMTVGSLNRTTSEVSALKTDADLRHADTIVVIMGPTGAGKSRFIEEATGETAGSSDGLVSGAFACHVRKHSRRLRLR